MFCPKCGNEVASGTRFCPRCGHSLSAVAYVPSASVALSHAAGALYAPGIQSRDPVVRQVAVIRSTASTMAPGTIGAVICGAGSLVTSFLNWIEIPMASMLSAYAGTYLGASIQSEFTMPELLGGLEGIGSVLGSKAKLMAIALIGIWLLSTVLTVVGMGTTIASRGKSSMTTQLCMIVSAALCALFVGVVFMLNGVLSRELASYTFGISLGNVIAFTIWPIVSAALRAAGAVLSGFSGC